MNWSKLTTPQLQAKMLLADSDQKKQIKAVLDTRAKAAQDTASLTGEDDIPEVDIITKEPVMADKKTVKAVTKAAPAKKAAKKESNRGANQVPELLGKWAKFPSRNGQQPVEGEIVKAFVDQRDLKVYVGVKFKDKMYFKQKDKAEIKGAPKTAAPTVKAPAAKATVAAPAKKAVVPAKKAAKKA